MSDIFEKYAFDAKNIYEFGCGPAYHLLQAREFNANCKLYGLDWAASSQKIISEIRNLQLEKNIFGSKFNYFEPDEQFKIHDDTPDKLLSTVIYLSPENNFGTFVHPTRHDQSGGVEVPWKKNRAFIFSRSDSQSQKGEFFCTSRRNCRNDFATVFFYFWYFD